ncbi:12136_t:CDS:2 [Entrophospora sp. SA101]|nr:15878_t:CDS:2 [Entrophospora sp. SA101]CAJ0905429.1 12136_t:CDS:2 [Entrophospora sp. SA101]
MRGKQTCGPCPEQVKDSKKLVGSRSKKTKAEKNEQSSNLPTSKSFLSSAKDLRLDEILYTIDAKPQKLSSGYGWTASLPNSRIKVEINGEEVELPVTINFNVSVQGSKK